MLTDVCYETLSTHFCRKKFFRIITANFFELPQNFLKLAQNFLSQKTKNKKKMRTKQNKKQNKIKTKKPAKLSCILQE